MPRRSTAPESSHHIYLYDSDWEWLEEHYGSRAHSSHRIGVSMACREIIHAKVEELRARQLELIDARLSEERENA